MSSPVDNYFFCVGDTAVHVVQEQGEGGGSGTVPQRCVISPGFAKGRQSWSLLGSPRIATCLKDDIIFAESKEDEDAGYNTPDEFLDSGWKQAGQAVPLGDVQPEFYPCAFGPEQIQDLSSMDPYARLVWIACVDMESTVDGAGFESPKRPTVEPDPINEWGSTVVTVMTRNLPKKMTQQMLLEEINSKGFAGTYDFVYLPMDTDGKANRGYAFVNFMDPAYSAAYKSCYEGKQLTHLKSRKMLEVLPAVLQGFEANFSHFSNTRANREDPSAGPLFLWQPSGLSTEASAKPQRVQKLQFQQPQRRHGWNEGGAAKTVAVAPTVSRSLLNTEVRAHANATGAPTLDSWQDGNFSKRQPKCQVNFCPFCGGGVGKDFKFCLFCGSSLLL